MNKKKPVSFLEKLLNYSFNYALNTVTKTYKKFCLNKKSHPLIHPENYLIYHVFYLVE